VAKSNWIWRETAEVIGVLGIIATLIFVALEIRQNTDAVRSSTVQDISRWSYDATVLLLEYPEVIRARQAACSNTLTDDQRVLLFAYYNAVIRIQVNRFQQAQLGILDQDLALNLGGRGAAYSNPYFTEVWSLVKDEFDPSFVAFIEREVVSQSDDACRAGI
jgi:hypothetical protein